MLGHWSSPPFNPDEYFGFVYLITCIPTGKMYVGKKNFRNKNGKESNWKNYTSSSKELNFDIKKLGKNQFLFEIIGVYKNKESLSVGEIREQENRNVLHEKFESGERKYYNRNIHGVNFDTTGMTLEFTQSHREKIRKRQTGEGNSFFGKKHTEEHLRNHSKKLSEMQKHGGFLLGKDQPKYANRARSEKLKGRVPANKGKPAHNKGQTSPTKGRSRTRKVTCNGNQFNSVVGAAKFFNLSENSVRHRLRSPQFPTWNYIT